MPRNRFTILVGAVAVLVLVGASFAVANDHGGKSGIRSERLIGYNEVPPISTTATGSFTGRIDPAAKTIAYTLTYSGLSSPALFAHIHFGQKGVAGGVSAFLCGGGGKPACPATSGTVSGTIAASDVVNTVAGTVNQGIAAGEFDELVRAMKAHATYANVHSQSFPGGEIRAQLKLVRGHHDDRH
jgi:CHRD domain-containing protein